MCSQGGCQRVTWEGATGGSCGTVEICRGFRGVLLAATCEPCAGNCGSRWGAGGIGHTGWLLSTCCRDAGCEMGCCCEGQEGKKAVAVHCERARWLATLPASLQLTVRTGLARAVQNHQLIKVGEHL